MAESSQSHLSSAWAQVLEKVQLALQKAEHEASEREKNAQFIQTNSSAGPLPADWSEAPARHRHDRLEHVKDTVERADSELAAGVDAFEQWHDKLQTLAENLAQWSARVIK